MRRGHPAKKKRGNISGLKNQKISPVPSHDSSYQSTSPAASGLGFDQQDITVDKRQPILPDSTRIDLEERDAVPTGSDLDDQMELDIWDDEDLAEKMEMLISRNSIEVFPGRR